MALYKSEALADFHDCFVTGTNHYGQGYDAWRSFGEQEKDLHLRRVKDNPHDANAVAVMFKVRQIGWVAKDMAQVIGPEMDAGHDFKVQLLRHKPHESPMCRLSVRLLRRTPALEKVRQILLFRGHIGHADGQNKLWSGTCGKFRRGTVLALRTTPVRTSVDLIDTDGLRVGWIRKEEVPGWEEHDLEHLWRGYLLYVSTDSDAMALMPAERMPKNWRVSGLYRDSFIHPDVALLVAADSNTQTQTTTQKENTMNNLISRLIDTNKRLAVTAAVLEAGRIANNTVTGFLVSRLTFLERFVNRKHINSPLGKLIVANGALALAQQVRPHDPKVKALTEAMATQAYQEVYQHFDIEAMIDGLLNSPEIKRAMSKLEDKVAE